MMVKIQIRSKTTDKPMHSLAALSHWLETAAAVAN